MTIQRVERQGSDDRPSKPVPPTRRANFQSGVTLIEMLAALMIVGVLLAVSIPAFNGAIGNNATRMEANRALVHIQLARSEAIKRGANVYMCIADAEACDPTDLSTCRCKVGVPAKRYDQGWLVFVDSDGDQDFDDDSEELLFVGIPPAEQVAMRSNNLIQFGVSLKPNGGFGEGTGEGEIALCFDGESTDDIPGRMVVVKVSGRTQVTELAPGESCAPDPSGDDDDDGGKKGKKGKKG